MAVATPIVPGDHVPRFALPDAHGKVIDLQHQSIAGRTIVLWLCRELPSLDELQAAVGMQDALAAVETSLYVVASLGDIGAAREAALPVLFDREGLLAPAFGVTDKAVVIIDSGGRLVQSIENGELEGTLPVCTDLHHRSSARTVTNQAPVLLVPNVAEPALCARMIEYWHSGEKIEDRVAASGHGNEYADEALKKRRDVVISDRDLFEAVKDRVARRLLREALKAFQVRLTRFEALRVGCYTADDRGYFRRHRDNRTSYTAHRLFAVSLNLNDDYEGGEVRFPECGRELYRPPAGGAVMFSCSLLHKALPVTTGRRFAMFTFFFDEAGAAREREMAAKAQAAGQYGVTLD